MRWGTHPTVQSTLGAPVLCADPVCPRSLAWLCEPPCDDGSSPSVVDASQAVCAHTPSAPQSCWGLAAHNPSPPSSLHELCIRCTACPASRTPHAQLAAGMRSPCCVRPQPARAPTPARALRAPASHALPPKTFKTPKAHSAALCSRAAGSLSVPATAMAHAPTITRHPPLPHAQLAGTQAVGTATASTPTIQCTIKEQPQGTTPHYPMHSWRPPSGRRRPRPQRPQTTCVPLRRRSRSRSRASRAMPQRRSRS